MFWIFRCKHPARFLHVEKDSTSKTLDENYSEVTYYLYCMNCGKSVPIKYCKTEF